MKTAVTQELKPKRCRKEWYEKLSPEQKQKEKEKVQAWRKANPEKFKTHSTNASLKKKYGITLEQYNEMFTKQNGCCDVCGKHALEVKNKLTNKLAVDHCHATGKVRALLCHKCNNMLGCCNDDVDVLKKAIEYLERNK